MNIDTRLRSASNRIREQAHRRAPNIEPPRRSRTFIRLAPASLSLAIATVAVVILAGPTVRGRVWPVTEATSTPVDAHLATVGVHIPWLPPGWVVIEETLTPGLASAPLGARNTIVSFATTELSGEIGETCHHLPAAALSQMGPTDALVSVVELAPDAVGEVPMRRRAVGPYLNRPESYYPYIGELVNDFCHRPFTADAEESMFIRHYIFSDAGRAFDVLVAMGPRASEATQAEVWQILDTLEFESRQ